MTLPECNCTPKVHSFSHINRCLIHSCCIPFCCALTFCSGCQLNASIVLPSFSLLGYFLNWTHLRSKYCLKFLQFSFSLPYYSWYTMLGSGDLSVLILCSLWRTYSFRNYPFTSYFFSFFTERLHFCNVYSLYIYFLIVKEERESTCKLNTII